MENILALVKDSLSNRYRQDGYGEIGSTIDQLQQLNVPVWLWLTENELRIPTMSEENASIGGLFDPDLAIVHLFLEYSKEFPLQPLIIRSLNLRSQLRRERGIESIDPTEVDQSGSWRIVLVWIVEEALREEWIENISQVRYRSGFSEELVFDAIFYGQTNARVAIQNYNFPRLLMTLRKVMRMSKDDEAVAWLSADNNVRDALEGFALSFTDPKQKGLARIIEGLSRKDSNASISQLESPTIWRRGEPFSYFSLKNFRGIESFELDVSSDKIGSAVIFGPNGTGKSSLTEAISIARFGTSVRHQQFISKDEVDIAERDRSRAYLQNYLQNIEGVLGAPLFTKGSYSPVAVSTSKGELGLTEEYSFQLVPSDYLSIAKSSLEANILTQEMSALFVNYSSGEVADRVLRGYSDLAGEIEAEVDRKYTDSNRIRQSYLSELGIKSTVTLVSSVEVRIAEKIVQKFAPTFPSSHLAWISLFQRLPRSREARLASAIAQWSDSSSLVNLADQISKADAKRQTLVPHISSWLQDYLDLLERLQLTTNEYRDKLGSDLIRIDDLVLGMRLWSSWLMSKQDISANSQQVGAIEASLQSKREVLSGLSTQLDDVNTRRRHLQDALEFVSNSWKSAHPEECPTCGATYSPPDGIEHRINALLADCEMESNLIEPRIDAQRMAIQQLQGELASSGGNDNPVSERDRSDILDKFQSLTAPDIHFESVLRDPIELDSLIAFIESLKRIPSLLEIDWELDKYASSILEALTSEWEKAREVFEEPNNWQIVQQALGKKMTDTVQDHLPNTVEQLWHEIVYSLTSASWVNRHKPRMSTATKNNKKQIRLEVKNKLAKYILNQSEAHVLGVSWFICDYLLRGRFEIPLIVMDDPAQEMDETTFREFCRFFETFRRLHLRMNRRLTMIILLHQESRALEIAKATNARFYSLQWKPSQKAIVEASNVVDTTLHAVNPATLVCKKNVS